MESISTGTLVKESRETESAVSNPTSSSKCFFISFSLRVLLMAASIVAVVLMRTANQTELVMNPITRLLANQSAQWRYSPAFIYFVVALSFTASYSATSAASLLNRRRQSCSNVISYYIALFDALMLGVVASATGAAGGVAYIGLKGNSYVGWLKVCSIYDVFCKHVGSSVALSLFASVLLLLLVMLNTYNVYRQSQSQC